VQQKNFFAAGLATVRENISKETSRGGVLRLACLHAKPLTNVRSSMDQYFQGSGVAPSWYTASSTGSQTTQTGYDRSLQFPNGIDKDIDLVTYALLTTSVSICIVLL